MSKLIFANRLRNHLAEIASEAVAFDGGAVPAPRGSWGVRPSGGANQPTEVWLKTATPDTGWTRQNFFLRVFNITHAPFNCVGDGVTDNTDGLRAVVAAAVAAGGGIIYIPPGDFAVFRKPAPDNNIIVLDGASNIMFLGDGFASQLRVKGSMALAELNLFTLRDGTNGITFRNFEIDGIDVTDPDPGEQHHGINLISQPPDTLSTNNIDIIGMWFRGMDGDLVRVIANTPLNTSNCRVIACYFYLFDRDTRTGFSVQRATSKHQLHWCYLTGSNDQEVDFEPTGVSGDEAEYSVRGNIMDNDTTGIDRAVVTITGTGSSDSLTAKRSVWSGNILYGNMELVDVTNFVFRGNVISKGIGVDVDAIFYGTSNMKFNVLDGNVFANLTNTTRPAITLAAGDADPTGNVVSNNICYSINSASLIHLESALQTLIHGNVLAVTEGAGIVGNSSGVYNIATTVAIEDFTCDANLIIGLNTVDFGARVGASAGLNMGATHFGANYIRNVDIGLAYQRGAAETFPNQDFCANNFIDAVTSAVTLPPDNTGAVMLGNAWPGCSFSALSLVAGPEGNVAAGIGSICTNLLGGQDAVFFYKATGGSGNTGWARIGGAVIEFGVGTIDATTTPGFMATGFDLATITATEIAMIMPFAGRIRSFFMKCVAGVGGDGNNSYQIRRNGVQVASMNGPNTLAADSSASSIVTVAAGDRISVRVTKTTSIVTPQTFVVVSMEVV